MSSDDTNRPFDPKRRKVLAGLAASAGVVGLGGSAPDLIFSDGFELPLLPAPDASGIDHIVVVMMENRSFDHYLGWVPGANGRQAGLRFVDGVGVAHLSADLAPNYQNCACA
ncbi:MAG TPA: alkaline phosphatase family protein, partial [Dokdonella sp.]